MDPIARLESERTEIMDSKARYGIGLALLLTAYVLGAFDIAILNLLVDLIYVSVLGILTQDPMAKKWSRYSGAGLVAFSVMSSVAYTTLDGGNNTTIGISSAITNTLVLALAIFVVLRRIATHSKVTISTVMGGVLSYALLAFMFSALYEAVDLATTGDFFSQGPEPGSDYLYFSFITLTTVGFGDLTPAAEVAKRLVVIQALVGQIFLVVLVARLVSLWGHDGPESTLIPRTSPPDAGQD
jgi:uncharacterized membrane protein